MRWQRSATLTKEPSVNNLPYISPSLELLFDRSNPANRITLILKKPVTLLILGSQPTFLFLSNSKRLSCFGKLKNQYLSLQVIDCCH